MGSLLDFSYTNIISQNHTCNFFPTGIISIAVVLLGILSYFRRQWFGKLKPTTELKTFPTATTQDSEQIEGEGDRRVGKMEYIYRLFGIPVKDTGLNLLLSPETTLLPKLNKWQRAGLAYKPESLPGGRWQDTPYGRIRVYEFGPDNGRRVVFVHGISTPSIVARDMLLELAEVKGCRVIIFDLPGRGYSDCCRKTPQDMRLFTSLILMATATSTSSTSFYPFNLIGYSLGGGIATSFASQFPSLVSSLVIISSGGLIPYTFAPLSLKISMAPFIPTWLATFLLSSEIKGESDQQTAGPVPPAQFLKTRGKEPLDIFGVMAWQEKWHPGFMYSYMNCMRNAPVFDRVEEWTRVGKLMKDGGFAKQEDGGRMEKILAIYGERDDLTPPFLLERIEECVGEGRVVKVIVEGGPHEVVVYQWEMVLEEIYKHWGI